MLAPAHITATVNDGLVHLTAGDGTPLSPGAALMLAASLAQCASLADPALLGTPEAVGSFLQLSEVVERVEKAQAHVAGPADLCGHAEDQAVLVAYLDGQPVGGWRTDDAEAFYEVMVNELVEVGGMERAEVVEGLPYRTNASETGRSRTTRNPRPGKKSASSVVDAPRWVASVLVASLPQCPPRYT